MRDQEEEWNKVSYWEMLLSGLLSSTQVGMHSQGM